MTRNLGYMGWPDRKAIGNVSAFGEIRDQDSVQGHGPNIELPLTQQTIEQLAIEAAFRGVTINDLIGELITAMLSKDLVPQMLDTDPVTDRIGGRET
jgi:hypothetical protein